MSVPENKIIKITTWKNSCGAACMADFLIDQLLKNRLSKEAIKSLCEMMENHYNIQSNELTKEHLITLFNPKSDLFPTPIEHQIVLGTVLHNVVSQEQSDAVADNNMLDDNAFKLIAQKVGFNVRMYLQLEEDTDKQLKSEQKENADQLKSYTYTIHEHDPNPDNVELFVHYIKGKKHYNRVADTAEEAQKRNSDALATIIRPHLGRDDSDPAVFRRNVQKKMIDSLKVQPRTSTTNSIGNNPNISDVSSNPINTSQHINNSALSSNSTKPNLENQVSKPDSNASTSDSDKHKKSGTEIPTTLGTSDHPINTPIAITSHLINNNALSSNSAQPNLGNQVSKSDSNAKRDSKPIRSNVEIPANPEKGIGFFTSIRRLGSQLGDVGRDLISAAVGLTIGVVSTGLRVTATAVALPVAGIMDGINKAWTGLKNLGSEISLRWSHGSRKAYELKKAKEDAKMDSESAPAEASNKSFSRRVAEFFLTSPPIEKENKKGFFSRMWDRIRGDAKVGYNYTSRIISASAALVEGFVGGFGHVVTMQSKSRVAQESGYRAGLKAILPEVGRSMTYFARNALEAWQLRAYAQEHPDPDSSPLDNKINFIIDKKMREEKRDPSQRAEFKTAYSETINALKLKILQIENPDRSVSKPLSDEEKKHLDETRPELNEYPLSLYYRDVQDRLIETLLEKPNLSTSVPESGSTNTTFSSATTKILRATGLNVEELEKRLEQAKIQQQALVASVASDTSNKSETSSSKPTKEETSSTLTSTGTNTPSPNKSN